MTQDELEAKIRNHIEIEGDMNTNIFLAICNICDSYMVKGIVAKLEPDTKDEDSNTLKS